MARMCVFDVWFKQRRFIGEQCKDNTLTTIQTGMLLTIDMKYHTGLWSIPNVIKWYTLVLAIVLRPLYIVDGVLTVITVLDEICAI